MSLASDNFPIQNMSRYKLTLNSTQLKSASKSLTSGPDRVSNTVSMYWGRWSTVGVYMCVWLIMLDFVWVIMGETHTVILLI